MANEGLISQQDAVSRIDPAVARPAAASDHRSRGEARRRSRPACRPRRAPRPARSCSPPTRRPKLQARRPQGHSGADRDLARRTFTACMRPQGILTARGGMTSHAAVVARGMGKSCVVGLRRRSDVDYGRGTMSDRRRAPSRPATSSPSTARPAQVLAGRMPTIEPELSGEFGTLMSWADDGPQARRPHQCRHARGCAHRDQVRRRGHRAVPHRAHVLRGDAHPHRARDDPGRGASRLAAPRWRSCCRCSARTSSNCSRS